MRALALQQANKQGEGTHMLLPLQIQPPITLFRPSRACGEITRSLQAQPREQRQSRTFHTAIGHGTAWSIVANIQCSIPVQGGSGDTTCTPWRTHGATKQKDQSARRGRSMGPRGRMMAATDLLPESETENGDRDRPPLSCYSILRYSYI